MTERAALLQEEITAEIDDRSNVLLARIDGQLWWLQAAHSDIDLSSIGWVLRAQKGTIEKMRALAPEAHSESSIGLVALARNLFENLVWLKLFNKDVSFGLLFYRDLLAQQAQSQVQAIEQAREDAAWFREVDKDDVGADLAPIMHILQKGDQASVEEVAHVRKFLSAGEAAVDAKARSRFSMYGSDAAKNGYGFQAHLIETKAIPHHEERLRIVEGKRAALETHITSQVSPQLHKELETRWNWAERARSVGMRSQYALIYSFTSRLLHCNAMNLITEKQLLAGEREILLDYVRLSVKDAYNEISTFQYPGQVNAAMVHSDK